MPPRCDGTDDQILGDGPGKYFLGPSGKKEATVPVPHREVVVATVLVQVKVLRDARV